MTMPDRSDGTLQMSVLIALLMVISTTLVVIEYTRTPSTSMTGQSGATSDDSLLFTDALRAGPKAATDWLQAFGPRTTLNSPSDINSVRMTDVEVDSSGDIFVTGSFLGDVTIGGSNLNSGSRRHGFIGKVSSNGLWEWLVTTEDGENQTGNAQFDGLKSDGLGNVYAYGWMNGQIDLNNSQLIMTSPGNLQGGGGLNKAGLIAKLDLNGVFDWAVTIDGSSGNDIVNDLAIRSDGYLYVVGQYRSSAMFDETQYSQNGAYNGFFGLLNPNNQSFAWVRTIGGTAHNDVDNVTQVEIDAFDNAIITGYYSDNAGNAFGQGHLSYAGRPYSGFIANLSTTNTFNWVSTLQSGTSYSPSAITELTKYGDTFVVAGYMAGVVDYDTGVSITANGVGIHTFVGQIDAMGKWVFAVRSDGPNSPVPAEAAWQIPRGISVDSNGLVAVTGQFSQPNDQYVSNATFGSVSISNGKSGGYLAGFDLTGQTWKWAVSFGSMGEHDAGIDVVHLPDGRMLTVGNVCLTAWCTIVIDGNTHSLDSYAYGSGILWATYPDTDLDGTPDKDDNCPITANADQSDIDDDGDGDLCDDDIDNDGLNNYDDDCDGPTYDWDSTNWTLDRDGDGCHDASEDDDDDADGVLDATDACNNAAAEHNWTSTNLSDWDRDGCRDTLEDDDDDADGILDIDDGCKTNPSWNNWTSAAGNDHDGDGCHDDGEDVDDDGDGVLDVDDGCSRGQTAWIPTGTNDYDADGCEDDIEDLDDDNDDVVDIIDICPTGVKGWTSIGITDNDGDGCRDIDEDDDDDDDGLTDASDSCPAGVHGWTSDSVSDRDGDGCKDDGLENEGLGEDLDDDGDQKHDAADDCAQGMTGWISDGTSDADNDGCKDEGEDPDDDNDGFSEDSGEDKCPGTPLGDFVDGSGCSDAQGDTDGDGVDNMFDSCPLIDSRGWDENGDGCIDDIDDDSVLDDVDICIDAPQGEFVGNDGCTVRQRDDDGDSITGDLHPQGDDQCAGTYANETAISFGCSQRQLDGMRDEDEDGITNLYDLCPNTPSEELASMGGDGVNSDGCSYTQLDDDEDGVANAIDLCPGTPNLHQTDDDGCSASQLDVGTEGVSSGVIIAGFAGGALLIVIIGATVVVLAKKNSKEGSKGKRKRRVQASQPNAEKENRRTDRTGQNAGGFEAIAASALHLESSTAETIATEDNSTGSESNEYESQSSEDDGVTVDEHGTEWYTDEEGGWWYKTPELDDWAIYEG